LKEFILVRDAAVQLYNALVDACASHPEHLAHFGLDPQAQQEDENSPPRIRFDIAFAQTFLQSGSYDVGTVWFAIESMFKETVMKTSDVHPKEVKEIWGNVKHNLRETLKRAFDQDAQEVPAKEKRQKSVRFASPALNAQCRSVVLPPSLPTQISLSNASLPNFCVGRDFVAMFENARKGHLAASTHALDICNGAAPAVTEFTINLQKQTTKQTASCL
jgi:hypothetical protein